MKPTRQPWKEAIPAKQPNWYGTTFPPTAVDRKLKGEHEILKFGGEALHCLHTPAIRPVQFLFIWTGLARGFFSARISRAFSQRF